MNIGYVRVSSTEQNPDRQIKKMVDLGIDERNIFVDKMSGKDFDREEYQMMKRMLRKGDVLYIDALDRLGRNYEGLISEWKEITRGIGADIVALDMKDVFDSRKFREMGDCGKLMEDQMLSLLSWVAEKERKAIRRRQEEGIVAARERGVIFGRPMIDLRDEDIIEIMDRINSGEITKKDASEELGISRQTFYKKMRDLEQRGLITVSEKTKHGGRRPVDMDREVLAREYGLWKIREKSVKEICKDLNISTRTYYKLLKEYGIK